jgi:hypothetical protein
MSNSNPSDAELAINGAQIIPDPPRLATSSVSEPQAQDPVDIEKPVKRAAFCSGYKLVFPEGQDPFSAYPFGLHSMLTLPWSLIVTDNAMALHSDSCTNTPRYTRNSSEPQPCSECSALHNHNIIMGIRHRALDGTHENTPWSYMSFAQLINSLKRKNQQIDQLKLKGLNTGKVLAIRNKNIDGWKRLAVAISAGNIKRISSLFRVELKNGAGVFGLLEKCNQAARLVYQPKSYDEADYHRAYLLWKLGGQSAANIAYRTLGVPSIDTARRHVGTSPLKTSAGIPTPSEINTNLAIAFDTFDNHGDFTIGMTMPIDEIKLQERLRWEPRTNMILGVCREHGHECTLEFRTMAQADYLVECLVAGRVHMAAEVWSTESTEYSVTKILISKHM